MTVMEAVDLLDGLVDESDPDVDFPNSFHAFQTAEGIRKAHPDKGEPQLCCRGAGAASKGQNAAAYRVEGGSGGPRPPAALPGLGSRSWAPLGSQPRKPAHPLPLAPAVPNLPCPSPSQTGSTLLGSCTTWGKSWPCSGSPR